MNKANQQGSVLIEVILALALVASIAFGAWAFSGRQDYKSNSDKKAAEAVAAAKSARETELRKQFEEQAKKPYKTFKGSSTYGTITFDYPKTWSAYVDETQPSTPINAYFYPEQVPGIQGPTAFALRIELVSTPYNQILQQSSSQLTTGQVKAKAYLPPKMEKVANVQPGTRLDGIIKQSSQGTPQQGAKVVITVRDKTLQIYTESTKFTDDFNNIILPSLTFQP